MCIVIWPDWPWPTPLLIPPARPPAPSERPEEPQPTLSLSMDCNLNQRIACVDVGHEEEASRHKLTRPYSKPREVPSHQLRRQGRFISVDDRPILREIVYEGLSTVFSRHSGRQGLPQFLAAPRTPLSALGGTSPAPWRPALHRRRRTPYAYCDVNRTGWILVIVHLQSPAPRPTSRRSR